VSRPGNFDKDLNLQGWFDETLADAPRGFFDKDAIGVKESDVQSAHGGDAAAAPAKTTRAHDRPLEWWLEAAEYAWFGDQKKVPEPTAEEIAAWWNSHSKSEKKIGEFSVEEIAAWWNGGKSDKDKKDKKDEKDENEKSRVYVHALPLDSRDDNVYVLPLHSFKDAPEEPLDYMKLGALERAAGLDTVTMLAMTSGWATLHPALRVAIASLGVLGAWQLLKMLAKSDDVAKKSTKTNPKKNKKRKRA
jgi:hypothetical protein